MVDGSMCSSLHSSVLVVCVILIPSLAAGSTSTDVKTAFQTARIVTDVLDVAPKGFLKVTFADGTEARLGNEIAAKVTANSPKVEYEAIDVDFYTLAMIDPDAPSRAQPSKRSWKHWLVVNIPGNKVDKGEVKVGYVPSAPPEGSGFHRYTLLLYKQLGHQVFNEKKISNNSAVGRESFNMKKFASLHKLGNPVKGNFFSAQYDESVPAVWKQVGLS